MDDTGVYVGGMFTKAGGLAANNLAKWEFSSPPPREVRLQGLVTDDGLPAGATLTNRWMKVSGPVEVQFADPSSALTTATFSRAGTYVLRLTAHDSDLAGLDEVAIRVRANQPPVVEAGPDQVIGFEEPLALTGLVSDDGLPEGAPVHHVWQQIYGPGTVTFDNPAQTRVTARFGRQGTYVLRLSANDSQFTTDDEVTVIVLPRNQPPSVYPGSTANIVFGTPHTLNATVTDDGNPVNGRLSVAWSVASGPGEVTFDDPTLFQPTVRFSAPGTYTLRMTATDSELTSSGQVTVRVNHPPNNPPLVNAGPDETLTNLVIALQGSVIDDGNPMNSALDVYWAYTGTSGTVTFASSNSPTTTVTFSQPGSYTLRLTAKDGTYTVSDTVLFSIPNPPPMIVSAGPDRAVTWPTNSLTLDGCFLDRGLYSSVYWSRLSGPGSVSISGAGTLTPTLTFSTAGTHVFNLRVWNGGSSVDDTVSVVVAPAGNAAPVVYAGPDRTWFISTNTLTLDGSATDDGLPLGSVVTAIWTQVFGPAPATFAGPSDLNSQVNLPTPGIYLLRLTANDGTLTNGDDLVITVKPPVNTPPLVECGPDVTIRLTNTLTLNGHVTDDARPADGVLSAFWRKLSGPGRVTLGSPNASVTASRELAVPSIASFSLPGTYVLRLETDDSEYAATDDLTVTVLEIDDNRAPQVDAGLDAHTLTYHPFTLTGSVSDDGLPSGGRVATLWSVVSGPAPVYFSDATVLLPYAQFTASGTYVLRLIAGDSRLSASDDVVIRVSAPTNQAPFVFAGLPIEVTRPNPALLQGVVLDDSLPLGYPLTTTWTKAYGPGDVTFVPGADDPLAWAYFSAAGQYTLRLLADDSEYAVMDIVTVTVFPGTNAPPSVEAGPDFAVALTEPASLASRVSDDGLETGLIEICWSQVSGPGTVSFSTLNGVHRATFSAEGDYTLRLTAHDGSLTNSDDVVVTVVDAGPPVVEIIEPFDGGIVTAPTHVVGTVASEILQSYAVECRMADGPSLSGPGENGGGWTVLASNSTAVVSDVLGIIDPTLLLNGLYELRLTATDALGRSAATEPATLLVDRGLKIGHFTLSFSDLTVPVGGIPIEVVRTYDSRDARTNDFGVGWSLAVRNIRVQKNRALAYNWQSSGGTSTGGSYSLDPVRPRLVTVTFPDGRVHKFEARPDPETQFGQPISAATLRYRPVDNTLGTLVSLSPDGDEVLLDGYSGFVNLLDYRGNSYEPTRFLLTGEEGTTYVISIGNGLEQMSDRNGNTLLISTDGVLWTNVLHGGPALGITFQRDAAGRIREIIDPQGNAIRYTYGPNGSLAAFTDRTAHATTFGYTNIALPHHLTSMTDPRGVQAIRTEFDAAGRMVRQTDGAGHSVEFTHDLAHHREIIRDRLGHVSIHEYDDHGNVVRLTDALGHTTQMAYDDNDNLVLRIDPLGRTNRFAYDAAGNRIALADALGHTTRLTYNAWRQLTSITDPLGHVRTNRYDAVGNLVEIRDALGKSSAFGYRNGELAWMTNALDGRTRLDVNAFGWITNRVNALGHVVSLTRDSAGNLLRQAIPRTTGAGLDEVVTRFEYDAAHRPVRVVTPDGAPHTTTYNEVGLVSVSTDALGRQTCYDYDDRNRLRRVTHPDGTTEGQSYDAEGRVTGYTNPLGHVTLFGYDPVGRPVATLFPDGSAVSNRFDAVGQLVATTDARGATTGFGYDLAGRLVAVTNALGEVARYGFDAAGNLTNSTDALGRSTTFTYDVLGQRVGTQFPDGTVSTTAYDAMGRRVAVTDPGGLVTRFGYDLLGRLTSVTNALGQVTRYDYDELGNRTAQTDANGHVTRFEYDGLGRRLRRTLPGGQAESYAYNSVGALIQHTDFNGHVTAYEYDARDRLLGKRPDPRTGEAGTTYAYDAAGSRINMIDASGSTGYRYDVRNRLVEKVKTWAAVGLTLALHYAHDANGNLTQIQSSDPNGAAVAYEYDALNRLSAVQDPRLGWTSYHYDAAGNLRNWTTPNGLAHACDYDAGNRVTNLVSAKALSPLAQFGYTIGPAGNRLSAREEFFHSPPVVQPRLLDRVYAYDDAYRLSAEQITGGAPTETLSYSYDALGNRLARNSRLLPQQWFSYDANDRLTTDSYDANGNTLVGRTSPTEPLVSDTYDFEDRLVARQTTRNGQPCGVRLAYDGDGNRVGKTVATPTHTTTTCYLVDEQNPTGYAQVLEEHVCQNANIPTLQTVYAYGHAVLTQDRLIEDTSGAPTWTARVYAQDGHRNVRFLTDIEGQVTDTYDYDAFGNLIFRASVSDPPTANPYRFTGEEYDADLDLYYLRARYHSPDTGRFWTADPFEGFISDPASLHRYSYVQNNPVNWRDPSGHYTLTEAVVTTQIASIVNTMAVQNGRDNLVRALGVGPGFLGGRAQEVYDAIETVQYAMLITDLTAAVQVGRAAPALLGSVWKMAGSALAKLSTLTPRQWLGLRLLSPPPTARAAAQAEALLAGGEGVVAKSVGTPYGPAVQSMTAQARAALSQIENGETLYKGGVLGRSETGASQFLSLENPLNPGYAGRYGIPPQNANFEFILTGRIQAGTPVITRPAPGISPNPGGGIEAVTAPGSFRIDSFHMP